MKTSIKDFAKNFQSLETVQLKNIVGGIGEVTTLSVDKRRGRRL